MASYGSVRLQNGEVVYYQGNAYAAKKKTAVVGKTGGGAGVSVRVAKGVSVRTGTGASQNIRGTVTDKYEGVFTITNQRIIMMAPMYGFELDLRKLSGVIQYQDALEFYEGASKSHLVIPKEFKKVVKILDSVEIPESLPSDNVSTKSNQQIHESSSIQNNIYYNESNASPIWKYPHDIFPLWGLIIIAIFAPPIAVFLVWMNRPDFPIKKKAIWTGVIVAYYIVRGLCSLYLHI